MGSADSLPTTATEWTGSLDVPDANVPPKSVLSAPEHRTLQGAQPSPPPHAPGPPAVNTCESGDVDPIAGIVDLQGGATPSGAARGCTPADASIRTVEGLRVAGVPGSTDQRLKPPCVLSEELPSVLLVPPCKRDRDDKVHTGQVTAGCPVPGSAQLSTDAQPAPRTDTDQHVEDCTFAPAHTRTTDARKELARVERLRIAKQKRQEFLKEFNANKAKHEIQMPTTASAAGASLYTPRWTKDASNQGGAQQQPMLASCCRSNSAPQPDTSRRNAEKCTTVAEHVKPLTTAVETGHEISVATREAARKERLRKAQQQRREFLKLHGERAQLRQPESQPALRAHAIVTAASGAAQPQESSQNSDCANAQQHCQVDIELPAACRTLEHKRKNDKEVIPNSKRQAVCGNVDSAAGLEAFETTHSQAVVSGDALVGSLNSSQQKAVLSDPSKPLLILAGPGSGKTATLTRRILSFVAGGVDPSAILAVSFTQAAAAEMKTRVKKLLKEFRQKGLLPVIATDTMNSNSQVETSTFHSIALKIVREHAEKLNLPADFHLFGETQSNRVVREGLRCYRQKGSSIEGTAEGRNFQPTKKDVMRCSSALSQAKSQQKLFDESLQPELAFIAKFYAQSLEKCKAIDFIDILSKALQILQEFPDVLASFQLRFQYLLVDEFQDTNNVQYQLMHTLTSGGQLTVVGDDDQSIFAFAGSTANVFSKLRHNYSNHLCVRLERNYRSSSVIVAASAAVISRNETREQKQAISVHGGGEPVNVIECMCAVTEAEFILSQIRHETTERKLKFSDIAILYRKGATGKYFQERLLQAQVPFNHHGVSFYRRKMVKSVMLLLRIGANKNDDAAFEKGFVLLLEAEGLSIEDAKKVVERVRVVADFQSRSMLDTARSVLHQKVSGSLTKIMMACGRKALKAVCMMISRIKHDCANLPGLLDFAVVTSKNKERFHTPLDKQNGATEGVLLNGNRDKRTPLEVLLDDADEFEERNAGPGLASEAMPPDDQGAHRPTPGTLAQAGANQAKKLSFEEQQARLRDFLDFLTAIEQEQANKIKAENENAVSLLTIHRSKGLEWKAVFVIKMNEGELPMSFNQQELDSSQESSALQEERRLCFVALSRASSRLYLSYRLQGARQGEILTPSRYIRDIPAELQEKIVWNPPDVTKVPAAIAAGSDVSCDPCDHAFVHRFQVEHRSVVSQLFGKWCQKKAFATDPHRLVAKVKAVAQERLTKKGEKSGDALRMLVAELGTESAQAADYGLTHMAYLQLPEDQRWQRQKEKQEQFAKAAMDAKMAGRPATHKQLAYLRSLGCAAVPKDMAECSRMIEQFKRK